MKNHSYIMIIIAVILLFANTAHADELSTGRFILDTVPGATDAMAISCAKAYHRGGTYRHMDAKVTLTCTLGSIRTEYDPSKTF